MILGIPKNYFDVAEIYQWRWLEECGQRLENVDQSHLVLASGKLVLQKTSSAKHLKNQPILTSWAGGKIERGSGSF